MAGGIKEVPIRARIHIGSAVVQTPYILSFNVHKRRGESTTFDASVKISKELTKRGDVRSRVVIYAGSKITRKIFTGYIKSAKIAPCWDDPGFSILNISGADRLSTITNKTTPQVNRARNPEFIYCEITGVICKGEKRDAHAGDGYSERRVWFDHGSLNNTTASYSTNIDVRSVAGIGDVVGSAKTKDSVYLQVDLISEGEG